MLPLAFVLRPRPPASEATAPKSPVSGTSVATSVSERPLGFSPAALQALLCVAGVACCVAMSMPQVHIVAYCSELGYGAARGAEMLSVMLGFGIASRLLSGWISGVIFDMTGSYRAAFINGIAFNLFNLTIAFWLLRRGWRRGALFPA